MSALLCSGWFPYLLAFVVGLGTAYWAWSRRETAAPVVESKVAPQPLPAPAATSAVAAPKVSAAPVVAAAATAAVAVPLMAAKKPKAKAAAKPKAKAAPKPKAAAAPVKATAAPKPKAAPAPKAAAAPKAKVPAAPKAKATAAPKAAAPKAKAAVKPVALKAAPAPKAKAAPKPKAAAKPKPAPKPVIPDNLELLKGVGPKLNTLLKSLGVSTFEQIANWSPSDVREIDSKLGAFAGRISRDNWIDQAKLLLKGDVAGFEKKYGSLGSEINRG